MKTFIMAVLTLAFTIAVWVMPHTIVQPPQCPQPSTDGIVRVDVECPYDSAGHQHYSDPYKGIGGDDIPGMN